jgi:hypothetical protein
MMSCDGPSNEARRRDDWRFYELICSRTFQLAAAAVTDRNAFVEAELGCDPDDYTNETADAWWESVDSQPTQRRLRAFWHFFVNRMP